MKKLIAVSSVGLMLGFVIALVNANADDVNSPDSSTSTSSQSYDSTQSNQPGSVSGTDSSVTKETSKQTSMRSKTCTDDSGKVLHRGEKGFRDCWNNMMKKQQSGMVGEQGSHSSDVPSDMSTTNQSPPQDTK